MFHTLGAVARSNAFYGQGTGPILRDRVTCTGQETRLRDCTFFSPDFFDYHFEDAGVYCNIILGRKVKISVSGVSRCSVQHSGYIHVIHMKK